MGWLKRRRYEELSESIREHLEEEIENLVEGGMSQEEATHAAHRKFGNVTLIEERSREIWQWPRLESVLGDVKYAARQLWRCPLRWSLPSRFLSGQTRRFFRL
jgi:hypothetical protein